MPSTSKKQADFMQAVAHSPKFAKTVGVPQSVGKEFSNADKNRKFSKGGDIMASKMNAGLMAFMAKKKDSAGGKTASSDTGKGKMPMTVKDGKKVPTFAAKKGGMTKMMGGGMAYAKGGGIESKGKTKGTIIKMKSGGKTC